MIEITNPSLLDEVVEQALVDAEVRSANLDGLEFSRRTNTLRFHAPTEQIYTSNGTCDCEAYLHGKPCYHRSMARILTRYFEREDADASAAIVKTNCRPVPAELFECGSEACGWRGGMRELIRGGTSDDPTTACPKCEGDDIGAIPNGYAIATIERMEFAATAAGGMR